MPTLRALLLTLFAAATCGGATAAPTGFLVLAPDRGFMGNEETRDAFAEYRGRFKAALAIVGTREDGLSLQAALGSLERQGAREVVALPLFSSESHPALLAAWETLRSDPRRAFARARVSAGPAFGSHPYARLALAQRASALSQDPRREGLVLVAQGAAGPESAARIEGDLLRAAEALMPESPFAWRGAVALEGWDPLRDASAGASDRRLRGVLAGLRREGLRPVLVCFDLSVKMDSMMRLSTRLGWLARESEAAFDGADLSPHPALAAWLARESNRRLPPADKELGIVYMPHGSDEAWNQAMLRAVEPLSARLPLEPAFGMGDPVLIERAIRRLEARGARRIAVVRVYSLASSFRSSVERALGLPSYSGSSGHAGHGHGGPAPRPILSASELVTVGGIEDSPLFAQALYDRARDLSRDPSSETVFLVAHGAEEDSENARWQANLDSLASRIAELSRSAGRPFRAVRGATLREDWPAKRAAAVAGLRDAVRRAGEGGRAIVVPARAGLGGPEKDLLLGLDFAYAGQSFAPHPKFLEWMQGMVREAEAALEARRTSELKPLR